MSTSKTYRPEPEFRLQKKLSALLLRYPNDPDHRNDEFLNNRLPLLFNPTLSAGRKPPVAGTAINVSGGVTLFFSEPGFSLNTLEVQKYFPSSHSIEEMYTGPFFPATQPGESLGYGVTGGATGTWGCVVQDMTANDLLLSCNHVIANENKGALGDDVWQPGHDDGGTATNRIGVLRCFKALDFSTKGSNDMDAAVARPDGTTSHLIKGIGAVTGYDANPTLNISVKKSGKRTGVTTGNLRFSQASFLLPYSGGQAYFQHQYGIMGNKSGQKFALGGDSGSLVLDENNKAVGLLFAVSAYNDVAVVSPIEPILTYFSVDFP